VRRGHAGAAHVSVTTCEVGRVDADARCGDVDGGAVVGEARERVVSTVAGSRPLAARKPVRIDDC